MGVSLLFGNNNDEEEYLNIIKYNEMIYRMNTFENK